MLILHQRARLRARYPLQRGQHVGDGDGEAVQVEGGGRAPGRLIQIHRADQGGDHAVRREQPAARGLRRNRQDRLLAGGGLADDAAEEAAGGGVRLARPHHDGGQAQRAAVDEALAREIRDHQLADHLLRAIGRHRARREIIGDLPGHVAAERRDRAGVDHTRLGAQGAQQLQQRAGAVHIHAPAEVEIRLRPAGDDGGQMEHGGGLLVDRRRQRIGVQPRHHDGFQQRMAEVGGGNHVDQANFRDLLRFAFGVEDGSPRGQGLADAATDEAGPAGDCDDCHPTCLP